MFNLKSISPSQNTSAKSASKGKFLDPTTTITHNGAYVATMNDVNNGLYVGRCDCPINNPLHEKENGMDYAHVVQLSGGEYGIHCGGSHCEGTTYIMSKPFERSNTTNKPNLNEVFGDKEIEDSQIEAEEKIDNLQAVFSKYGETAFFDDEKEKYCVKTAFGVKMMSKTSLQQVITSRINKTISKINIPVGRSDYRPDRADFFKDENGVDTYNLSILTPLMSVNPSHQMPHHVGMLLESLFNGDKEMMHHYLNWQAFILQKRRRTSTAWIFVGKQGTGKGLLTDLIRMIFGWHMSANITDQTLSEPTNPYMKNKLIVHFNEVSAESKKDRVMVKNRLKTWITDDTVVINDKHIKIHEQRNYCNIIIHSNEFIPVDIEEGDRRFNVVLTGDALSGQEWFDTVETADKIFEEAEAFASYLMGYKLDLKAVRSVKSSMRKTELINATKTVYRKIFDALVDRDWDFFEDDVIASDLMVFQKELLQSRVIGGALTSVDIHSLTCALMKKNMSVTHTTQYVLTQNGVKVDRIRLDGMTVRGVDFNKTHPLEDCF